VSELLWRLGPVSFQLVVAVGRSYVREELGIGIESGADLSFHAGAERRIIPSQRLFAPLHRSQAQHRTVQAKSVVCDAARSH
jgi:hypothetical protein